MERDEPNDVGLAAARDDQRLFSDERTKDLLNEKKLRRRALRPISRRSEETAGRIVGRDQRVTNGGTNRATTGKLLTRDVGVTLAVYRNGLFGHHDVLHIENVIKT